MGCWSADGNGICQTCGKTEAGHSVRRIAIEFLRAMHWHYGSGETLGGQPYEVLLCPGCAKDVHRRKIVKPSIDQDMLPIDWGSFAAQPETQGGHTR